LLIDVEAAQLSGNIASAGAAGVCSQAKWSLLLVRDRHTPGVHPLSVL